MLSLADFIDDNIEDIDDGKWSAVFQDAWEMMNQENITKLLSMLYDIGMDEEEITWGIIEGYILYRVAYELDNSAFGDMAESWSRLNWMISSMPAYYGKTHEEIKQHILDNAKELNLNIKLLDDKYSWDGSQEYDLGWFKPEYYNDDEY